FNISTLIYNIIIHNSQTVEYINYGPSYLYQSYSVSNLLTRSSNALPSLRIVIASLAPFNSKRMSLKISFVITTEWLYNLSSYLGGMMRRLITNAHNTPIITSEKRTAAVCKKSPVVISAPSGSSIIAITVTTASPDTLCKLKNIKIDKTKIMVKPTTIKLLSNNNTITIAATAPMIFPLN